MQGITRKWRHGLLRQAWLLALPGLGWLLAAGWQETPSTDRRIVSRVNMVLVNTVVLDKYGFPVAGLKAGDFQVLDSGQEQKIVHFQEQSSSLNIVLIIDSSGSTYKKMSLIKQGAKEFIRRIRDTRPQDRLAVVDFNDDITLLAPFSAGWPEKLALVEDRVEAAGGTSLYDALSLTCRDVLNRTAGREVVLLYTDGIDNKSLKDFRQAFNAALSSDATFFVVTVDNIQEALQDSEKNFFSLSRRQYYEFMQGEAASRQGDAEPAWTTRMRNEFPARAVLENSYRLGYQRLERLAESTGGKFYKVATYDDLPAIYRSIASELSYYYTIGFIPGTTAAGELRSIEVRVQDPAWKVVHRRAYYRRELEEKK